MEIGKTLRQSCGIVSVAGSWFALSVFLPGVGEKLYSHAAQFTDVEEALGGEYIEKAVDYEFVNGYSDGYFPGRTILSRGQSSRKW